MTLSTTLHTDPISSSAHAERERAQSKLPPTCFLIAGVTVITGMCLGFYMGINQDFTLTPVHAHLNLLGWVSLFLLGVYYRTHAHAIGRMAHIQVGSFVVAYVSMTIGMACMFLIDHETYLPLTIAGGVLLIVSMVQFVVIAWLSRHA
jgi:hypothetical protein